MAKECKHEDSHQAGHPEPLLKATALISCLIIKAENFHKCVVFNYLALLPVESLLATLLDSAQCPSRGPPSRDYRLVCHTYTYRLSV